MPVADLRDELSSSRCRTGRHVQPLRDILRYFARDLEQKIVEQVRITGRARGLSMSEQATGNEQAFSSHHSVGGEGVTKVMEPNVLR
jgi:hypothetical protein